MANENTDNQPQESNDVVVESNEQVSQENVKTEETSLETTKDNAQEESLNVDSESAEETEAKVEETVKEEVDLTKVTEKEQAGEVLKDKGFDYAKLQEEYNQTGEISKETRKKLAEAGITEDIIDNYVDGQKAKVEAKLNEIAEVVGGRDEMNGIIKWASENLDAEEKKSINNIKDEKIMKIILKDLKERMEEKEGKLPDLTTGAGSKTQANVYESKAQMMADIRDPRYYKDEAYMNKVKNKIEASVGAGTIKL